MTRDQALAAVDLADLLERIGHDRGLTARGHAYPCPSTAHEQTGATPPVEVARAAEGYDVWNCYVEGCGAGGTAIDALLVSGRARDVADALEQVGASRTPSAPARPAVPEQPARIVEEYVYTDEYDNPLFKVCRMEPKSFRQKRWDNGSWEWGVKGVRMVPYRLPKVLAALRRGEPVFVVEGEKDVHALEAIGKTATTNPAGAGKWDAEFAKLLGGPSHKFIVIGDDDEIKANGRRPGWDHAVEVWRSFQGRVGACMARLPAEGFKDVSEQLEAGVPFTSATLRPIPTLLDPPATLPINGGASESASAGALKLTARAMAARPAPERALQVVGPLVQRGMRTTIGAQTGEGKTTMALQMIKALVFREPFLDWTPVRPGRALILDLEQGEETLKARLREAGLDDTDAVDVLWQPAGMALDSDPADQALVHDTIKEGRYDLILMDPLYQMHRGNANDERVAADLMRVVDGWARDYNAALVIPMHARKPHPQAGKSMTIHDIAGSGTWNRNAEFVLGLQTMSPGQSRLWFFKDRIGLGPGVGGHWFLNFSRESGFDRSHLEDRNRIRRTLVEMLDRDQGATREELVAAGAGDAENDATITSLRRLIRGAHVNGDRYRSRPWEEQTSLLGGDMA